MKPISKMERPSQTNKQMISPLEDDNESNELSFRSSRFVGSSDGFSVIFASVQLGLDWREME